MLSELARLGAKLIIQRAVEDEFDQWLGRARCEWRPEAGSGKRNGFRPRHLQTAEGELRIEIARGSFSFSGDAVVSAHDPWRVHVSDSGVLGQRSAAVAWLRSLSRSAVAELSDCCLLKAARASAPVTARS